MSTRFGNAWVRLLAGILCLAVALTGCGSGSSSSSSSTSSGENASAQFIKKGQANILPHFGREATGEEFEEASAIVARSLKARVAGDFATQCETLNQKGLEEVPGLKSQEQCAKALQKYAEPLSKTKKARADTLDGSIAVLRVKGDLGYALYHGNDGKDYAVPMEKEDGSWKVSSLVTNEF